MLDNNNTKLHYFDAAKIYEPKIPLNKQDTITFLKQEFENKKIKFNYDELDVKFIYVANYNNICYAKTGYSAKSTLYSSSSTKIVEFQGGVESDKEWANFASAYQQEIFMSSNNKSNATYFVPDESENIDEFLQKNEVIVLPQKEVIQKSKEIVKREINNFYKGRGVGLYVQVNEVIIKCALIPVAVVTRNGKEVAVVNMYDKKAALIKNKFKPATASAKMKVVAWLFFGIAFVLLGGAEWLAYIITSSKAGNNPEVVDGNPIRATLFLVFGLFLLVSRRKLIVKNKKLKK